MKLIQEMEEKDNFSFINKLYESSLLRSSSHIKNFTGKDITDAIFLYFLVLQIFRYEFSFAPVAQEYAYKTIRWGSFDDFKISGNDLYNLISILNNSTEHDHLKDQKSTKLFLQDIFVDTYSWKLYLRNLSKGYNNVLLERRVLFDMEKKLKISNSNYRSMRRLIVDWQEITEHDKKLVITRMLQAFRTRFHRSELLPLLETLAKEQHLELKNVVNAETGKRPNAGIGAHALAAVAGAALGIALAKKG